MNTINLEITYTPDDLQNSYIRHFNKNYPVRSKLVMILGILLIILGFLLVAIKNTNNKSDLLGFSYVGLGVVAIVYFIWNSKTLGKRMYKKMPDFKMPYHYLITDEGIVITSKNISTDVKWDHFYKSLVCEDMILLYPNKFRYNLFPKRYFTDEQFEQLKNIVKVKVAK